MICGFTLIGYDYGAVPRGMGLPIMTSKTSMCQRVVSFRLLVVGSLGRLIHNPRSSLFVLTMA